MIRIAKSRRLLRSKPEPLDIVPKWVDAGELYITLGIRVPHVANSSYIFVLTSLGTMGWLYVSGDVQE